jgi:hypothetical protein
VGSEVLDGLSEGATQRTRTVGPGWGAYAAGCSCFLAPRLCRRGATGAAFRRVAARSIVLGRPRLAALVPSMRSARCRSHKSFNSARRPIRIVIRSLAGSPQTSHTRIIFSATIVPPSLVRLVRSHYAQDGHGTQPNSPGRTRAGTQPVQALARLRSDHRELLRLAEWEELSHAQLAVVFASSVNAIAIRLQRAHQRFAAALRALDEEVDIMNRDVDGRLG